MLDELGGTEDLQPLPQRLGDGVQHAVQDVEALRVQRRHERPVHHLLARRDRRPAASSASSTTTRSTSSRRSSTCSASRRPETIKGHVQSRFDGVSMRYSFDDAGRADRPADAVLLDARLARHLARRLEGRHHPSDDQRLGQLRTTTPGSCTTPTSTAPSCTTSPPRSPTKLRELVNLWFAEAGANDAFPLDDRSAVEIITDAAAAAVPAARPLRLLPRHRRRPRVAGGQHPQPLLHDRRARRHPRARRGGRAVRARLALRRARPLRQGQPAALRQQLRRHGRAEDRRHRGPADRREPDPVRRRSTRTARTRPACPPGSLSLYHGDEKVGEGRIKTQPGKFSLAGEGLCVGRDSGEPVTDDYPGARPHTFTGGTINRVAVDVSGEPYISTSSARRSDADARIARTGVSDACKASDTTVVRSCRWRRTRNGREGCGSGPRSSG